MAPVRARAFLVCLVAAIYTCVVARIVLGLATGTLLTPALILPFLAQVAVLPLTPALLVPRELATSDETRGLRRHDAHGEHPQPNFNTRLGRR